MTPTRIEIEVDELGRGRIVVNGEDISNKIAGFTLRARIGQLTRFRPEYTAVTASAQAETEQA